MKYIEFRVTFAEGDVEHIRVYARTINSGFSYALRAAKQALGNGKHREIARLEFWQVVS